MFKVLLKSAFLKLGIFTFFMLFFFTISHANPYYYIDENGVFHWTNGPSNLTNDELLKDEPEAKPINRVPAKLEIKKDINNTLVAFGRRLFSNGLKLNAIYTKLLPIAQSAQSDEKQLQTIILMNNCLIQAITVHKYMVPLTMISPSIKEDRYTDYYELIGDYLQKSKNDLEYSYRLIKMYYDRHLKNKSALRSADKAEEVIHDSLSQIDSTIIALSKVTGSSK